ncbi:MAG: hypothetical protein JXA10_15250, partial [Anaerolineae bacterium]|nr:hypothetical protein [Anaerolineae bacterium]
AAEAVLAALETARLHGEAGEIAAPQTSYYNIFFPDTSEDFKIEYLEQSPLKQWGQMLRNYYNTVTPQVWVVGDLGFHLPVAPQIRITSIYPSGPINVLSQVEMNLEIIGRRIAYGDFTIDQPQDDGSTRRLYMQRLVDPSGAAENLIRPGVSNTTFNWDVTLPVVSDGVNSNTELLVFTESVAFLDGRYREAPDAPWRDVGIVFDFNDNFTAGTTQRIINRAPESDALAVISIPPGSEFQAYSSVRTPDGRVIAEANEAITYIWPEDGLTWQAAPAPSGDYDLGLLMTAFGGTTGFTSTTVTVNNDEVDQNLLGALWTNFYFSLVQPADWSRLNRPPDGSLWMYSTNDTGTEGIYVIFIMGLPAGMTGTYDELGQIADIFETNNGVPLTNRAAIEVNGIPALDAAYSYETEAGIVQARGFVVFNPWLGSKGVGMLVAGEALEGAGDLDATYTLLTNHFTLIDKLLLTETDIRDWSTNEELLLNDQTRYPVRLSWLPGFAVGDWLHYAPYANETSSTFAAMQHVVGATDAAALLDQLRTDAIMVGAANFTVTDERITYGQNYGWDVQNVIYRGGGHTWHAILYTAERDDQPVMGRLYVTIYNGDGYAVWFETPDDDNAPEMFRNTFEPMLDGFLIGAAQDQTDE